MKSFAKICLVLLTALTLTAFSANAQTNSAPASTNKPAGAATKPKATSKPYAGTVASVDSAAKTFTITLHMGSKTKIKKDGEPATSEDIVVGQRVRGYEHKDEAGTLVATTVNIGEKKKAAAAAPATTPVPAAEK